MKKRALIADVWFESPAFCRGLNQKLGISGAFSAAFKAGQSFSEPNQFQGQAPPDVVLRAQFEIRDVDVICAGMSHRLWLHLP